MKKCLMLFAIMTIFLIGCSTSNTEETATSNRSIPKEEVIPEVENIPNCPWWEQKMLDGGTNFGSNVTRDGRYSMLYGYEEDGQERYILANLTEQNEWEMSSVAWENGLRKKTKEKLTDLAVCPDGSYIGVAQPEDGLPVFYGLKEDGEVTEWKLPQGILKWNKDKHEKVDWIMVNEKNQIVMSTIFSGYDYTDQGEVPMTEMSRTIVYDQFQQKVIAEREYMGNKNQTCVAGDYIFSAVPEGEYMGIRVYRMDGGETQAVMSHKKIRSEKYGGCLSYQNFVCYRGGNQGYWYTDFGIYRFPVKEAYDGTEELELVIPAEYYTKKDSNYNVVDMICSEGDSDLEFYVEIVTHVKDENGNEGPGDVILTRYAE